MKVDISIPPIHIHSQKQHWALFVLLILLAIAMFLITLYYLGFIPLHEDEDPRDLYYKELLRQQLQHRRLYDKYYEPNYTGQYPDILPGLPGNYVIA